MLAMIMLGQADTDGDGELAGLEGTRPAGEALGSGIKDFAAQRRTFLLADPPPAQAAASPPGRP